MNLNLKKYFGEKEYNFYEKNYRFDHSIFWGGNLESLVKDYFDYNIMVIDKKTGCRFSGVGQQVYMSLPKKYYNADIVGYFAVDSFHVDPVVYDAIVIFSEN